MAIFVLVESIRDLLIKLVDRVVQELELAADQLHAQGVAFQHGHFIGQGNSLLDELQGLGNELLAARTVQIVKSFELFLFCLLHAWQRRPLEQESRWPKAAKDLPRKAPAPGESIVLTGLLSG